MPEFQFACPKCRKPILCDTSYAGAQINCPICQKPITVPSPQAKSGGGGSGLTRIVMIVLAIVVAGAAFGGGGWYGWHLYSQHKAKVEAAKGNPAAQVPAPTVASAASALNLLAKVHQAYTNLTSLGVAGTSVSVIDMSQVTVADMNPNQSGSDKKTARRPMNLPKSMTNTTDVAIKLARPDLYRIEGTGKMQIGGMKMTNILAAWSAGATNYTLIIAGGGAYKNYTRVADRKSAFMLTAQSGGLATAIPQLFFDEGDDMGRLIKDWGQTDDEAVNGQDCYTLTGKMLGQKLKIWISKANYMILQSQITLGGPVSDADMNTAIDNFNTNTNMTPQQIAQMKTQAKQQAAMMTKIRGTITETYDNISANQTFSADDFNYPVPRGVRLRPSTF